MRARHSVEEERVDKREPTAWTVGEAGPTLRSRWLGAKLREARDAAGLTGVEVGKRMDRAPSTLSRWETGDLIPRPPEVAYMLDLYGVTGQPREALLRLAEEARQRGWWEGDVSAGFADYVWLESRAWQVDAFAATLVHGLLQTPEYAIDVIRAAAPDASEEQIERWTRVRLARQQRLTTAEPLHLSVVLDEAVLHRPVGGREVMREQLAHLIESARLPNVELRVLPFAAGTHASMDGPFVLVRFREDDDIVYLDTRGGAIYVEQPDRFTLILNHLHEAALAPEESRVLIAQVMEGL